MPTIVPPFVQYQEQLFPLRGLWNRTPPEGDRFLSANIEWGITTVQGVGNVPTQAVQFQVAGNSPVTISQICALVVDNNRCGSDVTFLFPDSNFELAVPAYAGGVFPVFTNALTFYAISPLATPGDVTNFQIMNTVPPPVSLLPSQTQSHAGISNALVGLTPVPIIGATISGTIEAMAIELVANNSGGATSVTPILVMTDGNGAGLWTGAVTAGPGQVQQNVTTLAPLRLRFNKGVNIVSDITLPGSFVSANLYFGVP